MILSKENTQLDFINSITHDGKVLVFATSANGTIYYTVRSTGFENEQGGYRQLKHWGNWQKLPMPDGVVDASVLAYEEENLTGDDERFLLRSQYGETVTTVPGPVQLISGLGYVYVFRQSDQGTLLVDRFVLDGMNNRLVRKLEVRYKRSRKKHTPLQSPSKNRSVQFDSLNFKDANGKPFYEPTLELNLQATMANGWFSVVLLPTELLEEHRWHFFFYHTSDGLDYTSVRASAEGLFDLRDQGGAAGIELRNLALKDSSGKFLQISGAPVATKYDLQGESLNQLGEVNLVRTATRVMLVVPTDQGAAVLDFSVTVDGHLSQLNSEVNFLPPDLLRGREKQLRLPISVLKDIKAYSHQQEPAKGRILGMERTPDGKIRLQTGKGDLRPTADQIYLQDSRSFDGLYQVKSVGDNFIEVATELRASDKAELQRDFAIGTLERAVKKGHTTLRITESLQRGIPTETTLQVMGEDESPVIFTVRKDTSVGTETIWVEPATVALPAGSTVYDHANQTANPISHELGEWEEAPPASNQLIGAGEIMALRPTGTGRLSLSVPHDLQAGDQLQIRDSGSINGWHDVEQADAEGIVLDTPWQGGKLINRSRQEYQGIQISGKGEEFDIALKEEVPVGCFEFRIKAAHKLFFMPFTLDGNCYLESDKSGEPVEVRIWFSQKPGLDILIELVGDKSTYVMYYFNFFEVNLADGRWHHIAYVWDKDTGEQTVYVDGHGQSQAIKDLDSLHFYGRGFTGNNFGSINDKKFQGQLADFRLWAKPRSQDQIQQTMYERLSGAEGDLVGYWPLSTIAEGNRLLDFSEQGNHGTITGNVFIPGRQLTREKETIAFQNDTLIAVTQGGSYTESFEFRGNESAERTEGAFNFNYWGKQSRTSEERTEHAAFAAQQHPEEALAYGWFKASCSFVVPQGVSLIRSFGIDHFSEEWNSMEVRNHTIKLTSDSISKQIVLGSSSLPALAPDYADGFQVLAELLATELEILRLQKTSVELSNELLDLQDQISYNKQRKIRQDKVSNLTEDMLQYESSHYNLWVNKLNYWLELDLFFGSNYVLETSPWSEEEFRLATQSGQIGDSGKFKFVPTGDRGYYYMVCKDRNRFLQKTSADFVGFSGSWNNFKRLEVKLEDYTNKDVLQGATNAFKIVTSEGKYIGDNHGSAKLRTDENQAVIFTANTQNAVPANPRLAQAKSVLEAAKKALAVANAELDAWPAGLTTRQIQQRKSEITTQVARIQETDIPAAKRTIIALRQQFSETLTPATGIPMTELFASEKGLTTRGGLLNFLHAKGDTLNLLASADGNIYLNYFDQEGQLRQPYYDTVSDSDSTTYETWVPAAHRLCLDASVPGAGLRLKEEQRIPLNGEWTIECKFFFPFPEEDARHKPHWGDNYTVGTDGVLSAPEDPGLISYVLFDSDKRPPVLVREGKNGRVELGCIMRNLIRDVSPQVDFFYPCGFDLRGLEAGWHHLTVVGEGYGAGSNTIFYLNGLKVGDIKEAAKSKLNQITRSLSEAPGSLHTSVLNNAQEAVARLDISGRTTTPIDGIGVQPGHSTGERGTNAGKMAEVRVWGAALLPQEVEMNATISALRGNEPGLLAYLPLNGDSFDVTGNGYDAVLANEDEIPADHYYPYTGTINRFGKKEAIPNSVISEEYSTVGIDPESRRKTAMLRRFLAYPVEGSVQLLSQQRVEELDLRWLGNAQINPTLLGFIEGAPPVPSENLTEDPPAYQGATSVELVTEEDLAFSWDREDASSLGMDLDLFVGAAGSFNALIASGSYKAGVAGGLSLSNTSFNQSSIGSSASSSQTNRLELRGHPESKAHFPHLGPRFVPKNVGYALVVSGTADVYITRLRRSGRMVAYSVRPNPDIPLDVNTITFLINPAYTMNGSLDGLTGTRPTSDRFFKEVPEMRVEYGASFPASYYRVAEAYELKGMIEKQDKEREAYFANFNVHDLEGEVDRVVGEGPGEDDETQRMAEEKQAELESRIESEEEKVEAMSAFATWQRKMESLLIKARKRNIVNTYVWDADGGLRVEEQQFAGTVEHTVGGSFYLGGSLGFSGEFEGSAFGIGAAAALNVAATLSMSQTMSKTASQSAALSLAVDLSGLESQGITDFRDTPLLPGEKVDRYRFMSFFLEGSTNHFDDFFKEVVDPEWLAGNDEEARALRLAQSGKPNKAWRVFHRVTYVERPALQRGGKK